MDNFDLRKYLAENKLVKEELTYEFSEYDFDITKEPGFQEEVIKHIKSAHPNIEDEIMMKIIRNAENYYYSEARAENKRGREYEPVSSSEFADGVIMDYEDQLPYLDENKLLKEAEEPTGFLFRFSKEDAMDKAMAVLDQKGIGYNELGVHLVFHDKFGPATEEEVSEILRGEDILDWVIGEWKGDIYLKSEEEIKNM